MTAHCCSSRLRISIQVQHTPDRSVSSYWRPNFFARFFLACSFSLSRAMGTPAAGVAVPNLEDRLFCLATSSSLYKSNPVCTAPDLCRRSFRSALCSGPGLVVRNSASAGFRDSPNFSALQQHQHVLQKNLNLSVYRRLNTEKDQHVVYSAANGPAAVTTRTAQHSLPKSISPLQTAVYLQHVCVKCDEEHAP